MKAVVIEKFGGPEVLQYVELPKPVPEAGQVLVRNTAINVGKPDALVRQGRYPYLKTQLPLVLGNECAGYVEAVGPGVKDFRPGMPVLVIHRPGFGAYAQYTCVDQKYITPLPDNIPPEKAAGLAFFEIAYALLHDAARGTDGKSLYIPGGAGGLGTALIKLARHDDWQVIASAGTDEKCAYLRRIGASCVLNSRTEDPRQKILAATNGRGVDVVFDQLTGPSFFRQFDLLADFGMVVVYNWLEGDPEQNFFDQLVAQAIHSRAIRPFSFHVYDDKPQRMAAIRDEVFRLIGSGAVTPEFYGVPYPMSQAVEAHRLLDAGAIMGKMCLDPNS